VVYDAADETIKSLWLDVKFTVEAFGAMNPLVIEKMELGGLQYRWCRVENTSCHNFIPQLIIVSLPVVIIFHPEIGY
jgi:hypothetical protein